MSGCLDCKHMKLQKRKANGKIYYFGICEINKEEIEPKMAFSDWECDKFANIHDHSTKRPDA